MGFANDDTRISIAHFFSGFKDRDGVGWVEHTRKQKAHDDDGVVVFASNTT